MIRSRTSGSLLAAYCRNQPSTRSTASSSPGRTSSTAGSDRVAWTTGFSGSRSSTGARRTSRTGTVLRLLFVARNRNGCRRELGSGKCAGSGDQGRDLVTELVGQEGGRRQQLPQVVAGVQAHPLQQEHQVVGGDVAGRPRGERAAADAAGAGVQHPGPQLDGGDGVGEAGVAGVVEVEPQRRLRAHGVPGPGHEVRTWDGTPAPMV